MSRTISISLGMLLLLPLSSFAAPTITCHCFTDRSYDPSRPSLADPYFLAATQNSFIAALFNIDKKMIVMKKQSGIPGDDLWIAYWIAAKSGSPAENLLAARKKNESWHEVIRPMGLPAKSLGQKLAAAVTARAPDVQLARLIVDDVLLRHRLISAQDLATLRKEQSTHQETIIAALIALKTKREPVAIFRGVKTGAQSWGALLSEAKLHTSGIQAEFAILLK